MGARSARGPDTPCAERHPGCSPGWAGKPSLPPGGCVERLVAPGAINPGQRGPEAPCVSPAIACLLCCLVGGPQALSRWPARGAPMLAQAPGAATLARLVQQACAAVLPSLLAWLICGPALLSGQPCPRRSCMLGRWQARWTAALACCAVRRPQLLPALQCALVGWVWGERGGGCGCKLGAGCGSGLLRSLLLPFPPHPPCDCPSGLLRLYVPSSTALRLPCCLACGCQRRRLSPAWLDAP